MNATAGQDLRSLLLESCHPATLVALLQTPRDPHLLQKILETDAAVCAVAVEALRQHDALTPASWSPASLAGAVETLGLHQALTHIALHRLSAPLSPARRETLHQTHRQSLIRACLARQLAQDLGYPDGDEAYLMGLLLHVNQLLPASRMQSGTDQYPMALGWFQRWRFPVAAQDALRYRDVAIADLQGLHLLTLVLRLADDYSDAERRTSCPPSPILQQAMADAAQQAAQHLPETTDSILFSALAAALNGALPAPATTEGPSWINELRSALGPIALHRFSLDPTRQLLQGEESHLGLRYLRIPVDVRLSAIAKALLNDAWIPFNSTDAPDSTSRIDEQVCRLMDRAHFVAIPAQDAVWVAGLDDQQWLQYHARQEQLHTFAQRPVAAPAAPEPQTVSLQFCREVLHEASAPLTTVRNYLYVLGQQMPESAREELGLMRTELDRLSSILQQLRNTPKPGTSGLLPVNRVV